MSVDVVIADCDFGDGSLERSIVERAGLTLALAGTITPVTPRRSSSRMMAASVTLVDSGAGVQHDRFAVDLGHRRQLPGEPVGIVAIGDVGAHDEELVAAQPADHVARSGCVAEQVGDVLEHGGRR